MKKVFLFGKFSRLCFILSFIFIQYAMIDMFVQSGFKFKYLLFTIVVFIFVVVGLFWIYSLGIVVDYKNDKLKIILGLLKQNRYERVLSSISSLDIENDQNISTNIVINYCYGGKEIINYTFYRVAYIEAKQFKRLKKNIKKLKLKNS